MGTYQYSFVNENDAKIQEDYIVEKKPTHAYEAPEYIRIQDEYMNGVLYKLIGPKGIQYSAARHKNDHFHIIFKYKSITTNFTFKLIDEEQNLLEMKDDLTLTYRELDASGKVQLNTTYIVSGENLTSPENINPISFMDKKNITYNAPVYLQYDEYIKYKNIGQSLWVNLTATELNPEISTSVEYELIKSKFLFLFADEQGNYLKSSIEHPINIKATETALDILHTDVMEEDEYYILEAKPSNPNLYPLANLENYPTVILKASEYQNIVSFTYLYKRITGKIIINYLSVDDNTPIDVEEYLEGKTFINVASLQTLESGSDNLEGVTPQLVIPKTIVKNQNKKWEIDIEKSSTFPKLIITPEAPEIIYNFYYKPKYQLISTRFLFDSACEQRTYVKFLLLDENQTIVAKFDLGDTKVKFIKYGLSIDLEKIVMNHGVVTDSSNIQTSEQKFDGEVRLQNEVETVDHASQYGIIFKGDFVVDLANATISKKFKLVSFINLPGIGTTGLHDVGHRLFELRYNNTNLNTTYVTFVPLDLPRLSAISFTNPQFDVGMKFQISSGGNVKAIELMTIDLSKDSDEKVFVFNTETKIKSSQGVFTVS